MLTIDYSTTKTWLGLAPESGDRRMLEILNQGLLLGLLTLLLWSKPDKCFAVDILPANLSSLTFSTLYIKFNYPPRRKYS